MFSVMTSVCSTLEYYTIIHLDTLSGLKVILVNILGCRKSAPDASMCPVCRQNWASRKHGKNMHIQYA